MSRAGYIMAVVLALAVAGAGGYWLGRRASAHSGADADEPATQLADEQKPVAHVTVIPLQRKAISQIVTAYGTVVAEPGEVRAISVPFESRVVRVLVTSGQRVAAETELLVIQASPEALVALQEARNAFDVTSRDIKQVEQRFADHLATNQELSQAQQAFGSAKLRLETLTSRGVAEQQHLKAGVAGLVSKIDVQEGQIMPAGAPLVELAQGSRLQVQLELDPGDARALQPDQPVQIIPLDDGATQIEGKVRVVGQRVDPVSRLVNVLVAVPPEANLLLDSFITGKITRATADALVVPRDAALPDETGKFSVWTITNAHATKHAVSIGLENEQEVQIISDELKPLDFVVISGNYQLEDGMQVEVDQPTTEPASPVAPEKSTTAPATAETSATEKKP